jgi:hypothetical protein
VWYRLLLDEPLDDTFFAADDRTRETGRIIV